MHGKVTSQHFCPQRGNKLSERHGTRAILPSPYQLTSSLSISDLQKPTDFCPYLKSTTAFPPASFVCRAIIRFTSSKFFNCPKTPVLRLRLERATEGAMNLDRH
jgi:hypothetical protein